MKSIDLLKKLITFDSSTKEGANETARYCLDWLLESGLEAKLIENKGFEMVICEIGSGEKKLILNGHLDVVSANEKDFTPYEEDGKLYGRGSADMKAGVAAMMCCMKDLKDSDLPCVVQLQLVTDEETGGMNCAKYLAEQGYHGDFVICGEPTQLGVGVQAKGILQIDIDVFGKSAHGSRPWQGENAIIKAHEIFKQILDLPFSKESSELYENPSINLSKMTGGEVYNKVPDSCRMSLDIRFLPTQTPDEILSQVKSVAGEKISVHMIGDPVKTKVEDACVKSLIKSIQKVTSVKDIAVFGQHGSADSRFFSKYDIPAVEFGPTGANWHGDDEYVEIDSVESYLEILKNLAMNF